MRLRRTAAALAAMLTLAAAPLWAQPAAADPVTYPCVGAPADEPNGGLYPERRSYLVWQGWWTYDAPGSPQSHIHMEGCVPDRETLDAAVTPSFTANIKLVMHDNPGSITYASMIYKGTDYETTVEKEYINGLSCPVGVCSTWVQFSQPLSLFGHTGLQEIRFRVFVPQPNGPSGAKKEQHTSLNIQNTIVGTGKSVANVTRELFARAKGWWTTFLYTEATAIDADPAGPGLVPDGPVSGIWSPVVRQVTHSSDASFPVTHVFATLDANFHATPPDPGMVLYDHDGDTPQQALSIDTTQLANGVHKLLLKTSSHSSAVPDPGTNEGVVVIPFLVQNP